MRAAMTEEDSTGRHRLDRWLWFARFFKTRALATQAVSGGRVKVNGERVKPAHDVRVSDRLTLNVQYDTLDVQVLAIPARRGPASEAQACYAETPESVQRRAASREQRRLANLSRPQPDTRPDKRERRQLDKLRRQQS
jgi:ribosome-associated heat shock protein Hsp15